MANPNLFEQIVWVSAKKIWSKEDNFFFSYGFEYNFVTTIPFQSNADDCGVNTCLFAHLVPKDGNHNLLLRTEMKLNTPSYKT